jgi:uridylate kinase
MEQVKCHRKANNMRKIKHNYLIFSLGGSLIVPDGIDTSFLRSFKKLIEARIRKGERFVIITGGGKTSRRYAAAARQVCKLSSTDLDWLGIHATRLNAHLVRTVLKRKAMQEIITNPHRALPAAAKRYSCIIASGYKPGSSTDLDAVILGLKLGADTIVNLSNIDFVFDKDPAKYKDAKSLGNIRWAEFRKLVGDKWDPGLNLPFDPVASKVAHKSRLRVVIMNGRKMPNLKNFLDGKKFKGTVIE